MLSARPLTRCPPRFQAKVVGAAEDIFDSSKVSPVSLSLSTYHAKLSNCLLPGPSTSFQSNIKFEFSAKESLWAPVLTKSEYLVIGLGHDVCSPSATSTWPIVSLDGRPVFQSFVFKHQSCIHNELGVLSFASYGTHCIDKTCRNVVTHLTLVRATQGNALGLMDTTTCATRHDMSLPDNELGEGVRELLGKNEQVRDKLHIFPLRTTILFSFRSFDLLLSGHCHD